MGASVKQAWSEGKMKRQTGFTLVEIAIVLVIIGLLLGGMLKGQELIDSARVKNIAQDFRALSIAVLSYQDKYRSLPGDDAGAASRWGASTCQGNGDGIIEAGNSANAENLCLWQHLRLANLLTGDSTSLTSPRHTDGGAFTVLSRASDSAIPETPGSLIVCAENIRGRHVASLDTLMDDGNPHSGSMRAKQSSPSGVTASGINENGLYTVCMGF
jgi:prepilin-type N-terminal cleavage/methylation domain-containing protein